ncbi:BREX-2 system phosphatase PglZ [Candidatus Protofrankia californiensis]|uniref:BREX-2 system phosphatase PglZ n=1 Tax=Candidatus Protofrankia californiensis TaxID=1839754 RepID=UPI0010418172|nr:BREX-2 system phosphatase PglZ [Candidatus Protofrankia californiensis]
MTAPSPPGASRAPWLPPAAVEARVRRLLRASPNGSTSSSLPVIVLYARPEWPRPGEFRLDGHLVRVVSCVSPLAVLEQVTRRAARGGDDVLVLLTDADEAALGDGVLSQIRRHRVHVVEPWAAVEEDFGATRMDPQLVTERWAAQALLEARPRGGWPRLAGAVLSRDVALGELALSRLGLHELGIRPADLDAATLLRWSVTPGRPEAFRALPDAERTGLTRWLVDRTGRVTRALFALVDAGHGADALAFGLVCDCLWNPAAPDGTERAKGRADLCFGDARLDDVTVRAFADAVRGLVVTAVDTVRPGPGGIGAPSLGFAVASAATLHPDDEIPALLDRAEWLLDHFGGRAAGAVSDILPIGFNTRLVAVAVAARAFLSLADPGVAAALAGAAAGVVDAVGRLRQHRLAELRRDRVERAAMAARVVRWLAAHPTPSSRPTGGRGVPAGAPTTMAAGLDAHLTDWAWVDVALAALWTGDGQPELAAAYGELYQTAARRRRDLDGAFVRQLARWTAVGGPADGAAAAGVAGTAADRGVPLLVEEILDRVVAPALQRRDSRRANRMLLVVLDGMSAAVAAQLGQDLRRERWAEFDPLGTVRGAAGGEAGGPGEGGEAGGAGEVGDRPRRRCAVAVLPTVTSVSRASLLAGRLVEGRQDLERSAFETHPRWHRRSVRLFHSGDLRGAPGAPLGEELIAALTGDTALVGVVINTVDDTLDKGRERYDAGWTVNDIGALRAVLDLARTAGRAVVLTSDHGHVIDHGGEPRRVDDALSARHRAGAGPDPLDEGEVRLNGPRVLAPGGSIVALWDPSLRYTARKAGYHGGASPAEVTVPVLAFLPFAPTENGDVPPGWRTLPDQRPGWWSLDRPNILTGMDSATVHLGTARATAGSGDQPTGMIRPRGRRRVEQPAGPALFDLLADGSMPGTPHAAAGAQTGGSSAAAGTGSAPAPSTATDALVTALLAAELFQAQLSATPRAVPVGKVEAAVRALLDANGTLTAAVVAERAGERPVRAAGFAVTLQRIFNVDNYPVLSLIDDGRTLRLDVALLREQFGLTGQPGAGR